MKKKLFNLGLLVMLTAGIIMPSCGPVHVIPSSTSTTVNIKDSTVVNYIDSVRITERSVYKDYTGLLDTLRIKNERASMTAWADTTHNLINGKLVTEPVEEKTKIIYKNKIEYRDSVRTEQVPVPYEVEKIKTVVPTWCWYSLIFNMLVLILIGLRIWIKSKGLEFPKLFKN